VPFLLCTPCRAYKVVDLRCCGGQATIVTVMIRCIMDLLGSSANCWLHHGSLGLVGYLWMHPFPPAVAVQRPCQLELM
jgi:hypothetical protein